MTTNFDTIFAPRMSRFKPSPSQQAAVRVRELIAQGEDIIKLTTGEPDFPTPDHVKDAVIQCMHDNAIGYTPINGTLAMREAVQAKFRRDNNLDYALDEITVGSGTKQVIYNALMSTVHGGDEVMIASPYWTSYPDMVKLAGGTPVIVDCPQSEHYKLLPEQLEAAITAKTKWLIFSSPSNPTGATYNAAELRELADVLLRYPQVHILCDDVYEHLVFDDHQFATLADVEPGLKPRSVVCNGVSKAYSMTGWRVGFAAGPKSIINQMSKVQSQSTAGVSAVSQAAAVAALTGPLDFVHERTRNLQKRRDILFNKLSVIEDLRCDSPQGAMYIYTGCPGVIGKTTPSGSVLANDTDFVMYLLDTVGVALVQGAAYGMSPYFRASFVASEIDLNRGAELISQACSALS